MSQAPKFNELQGLVKTALKEYSYFRNLASQAAANWSDNTIITNGLITSDMGLANKEIENNLMKHGFSVVVNPVLQAMTRDQAGKNWLADAEIMVLVQINVETNARSGSGLQVDIYEAVTETINAVCQRTRSAGGEFFRLAKEAIALLKNDEGLFAYGVNFTKEVQL